MSGSAVAEYGQVIRLVGRWATLATGEHITPIPPFSAYDYDDRAFAAAIEEFHRDPYGVLARDGLVQRVGGPPGGDTA